MKDPLSLPPAGKRGIVDLTKGEQVGVSTFILHPWNGIKRAVGITIMSVKIIIAGIGGQGVLFAHQLIAEGAIVQNLNVTGAETHGMSQRGGSVVSHLKIGDTPAPLIRQGTTDFMLAMDAGEAYRSIAFVRPGGIAIVNTNLADFPDPRVRAQLRNQDITLKLVDGNGIAQGLGRASSANVILVGFLSTLGGFPISRDALREATARLTTERYRELNLKAFDRGVSAGSDA